MFNTPAVQDWVADQTVTIGASSTPSNAFGTQIKCVLLVADASCSIAWTQAGATINPATATNVLLPANTPRLFGVAGMI